MIRRLPASSRSVAARRENLCPATDMGSGEINTRNPTGASANVAASDAIGQWPSTPVGQTDSAVDYHRATLALPIPTFA
jgi:hypothetical protein